MIISVVTVTYNDYSNLIKTYKSISEQKVMNYQWIVIDGGSSDGTIDFLKTIEHECSWISESDNGIYDAMNKGVEISRGEFIVFMNAGDLFTSNDTLHRVGEHLNNCKEVVDVCMGGATLVFPNGRKVYRSPRKLENSIWHGLPANHQATYYRSERLRKVPYDLKYFICGDYYLIAKLFIEGVTATYMDESLADFSVGGTSYTNRTKLFYEPYLIQKDVLGQIFYRRLLSFGKRALSTAIFIFLYRFPKL